MAIEDYEAHELDASTLKDLCLDELGISWNDFPDLLESLYKISVLSAKLEVPRFHHLYKATTKEDKMDCPYVRKCLILLMRDKENFLSLMREVGKVSEISHEQR